MDYGIFERFEAVAARWDLQGLHRDVASNLDDLEESERPYVPSRLVLALDMFLDSYGPGEPGSDPSQHDNPLGLPHDQPRWDLAITYPELVAL